MVGKQWDKQGDDNADESISNRTKQLEAGIHDFERCEINHDAKGKNTQSNADFHLSFLLKLWIFGVVLEIRFYRLVLVRHVIDRRFL